MNYKAYQNCEFDKAYAQTQTRMHVADNKLRAGDTKTCSVGCMFEGYNHELSEAYYGIDERCIYALDAIYEGLPTKDEQDQFHIDYYDAIPIGGDTRQAWHNYMSQLMLDPVYGMIVYDKSGSSQIVGLLHLRAARGDIPKSDEWEKAAGAREATWETARAAIAAIAVNSAAWVAESLTWAAWVAARAKAGAVARENHYQWQRDTLLQCLKDC